MRSFTFEEIFGVESYQDSEHIVIAKTGLIDSDSPESILMALLQRCLVNGQITANSEVMTVNDQPLEYNNLSLYQKLSVLFTRNQIKPGYLAQILKVKIFLPSTSENLDLNEL